MTNIVLEWRELFESMNYEIKEFVVRDKHPYNSKIVSWKLAAQHRETKLTVFSDGPYLSDAFEGLLERIYKMEKYAPMV